MNELQKVFDYNGAQVRTISKDGEPWFVAKDVCDVPKHGETDWHGCVYVTEYGDALKIGHTTNLQQRMKSITSQAKNYSSKKIGRIVFSKLHTNHKENELALHRFFKKYRVGKSELFDLTYEEFLKELPSLEFKDESKEKQAKSDAFLQGMKGFILGGE